MEHIIAFDPNTGEVVQVERIEPVDNVETNYLSSKGTHIYNKCEDNIGEGYRHPVTPLDPASKYPVAMKLGLEMFELLNLAAYKGRVIGFMKKSDRPSDASYIQPEMIVGLQGSDVNRCSSHFCIAIAPKPKKTDREVLEDLVNGTQGALEAARKHLDE